MLSSPFHIVKLATALALSKIGGNASGAHLLQVYRKNEYGEKKLP